MKLGTLLFAVFIVAGCASRSVLPSSKDVQVSREEPKHCREMGMMTGRTASVKGNEEQALEDLKHEAAIKGANYVVVKQFSDYGTAVTGIAYECP